MKLLLILVSVLTITSADVNSVSKKVKEIANKLKEGRIARGLSDHRTQKAPDFNYPNPSATAFQINADLSDFPSSKIVEVYENHQDNGGSNVFLKSQPVEAFAPQLRHGSSFQDSRFLGSFNSHRSEALEERHSGYMDYSQKFKAPVTTKIVKPVIRHGAPIVTRSFFIHEAPTEEPKHVEVVEKEHVVRPRKHYNIVFVKAPPTGSKTINKNNVNVYPQNEEKTIVYVLSGKDEVQVDDQEDIQIPEPRPPAKPEVVFVKYDSESDIQKTISDIKSKYEGDEDSSVSIVGSDHNPAFNLPHNLGHNIDHNAGHNLARNLQHNLDQSIDHAPVHNLEHNIDHNAAYNPTHNIGHNPAQSPHSGASFKLPLLFVPNNSPSHYTHPINEGEEGAVEYGGYHHTARSIPKDQIQ